MLQLTWNHPNGPIQCAFSGDVGFHVRQRQGRVDRVRGWRKSCTTLYTSYPKSKQHSVVAD